MDHYPDRWGRPRREDEDGHKTVEPKTHTKQPIVTGTSVVGIKFDKGVMLAADNLASYGSLARFENVERLFPIEPETVVGIGGDVSDMQYLERQFDELMLNQDYAADGHVLQAKHVFEYLSNLMYSRRSKMDPLWNSMVVGGMHAGEDEKPFLAFVDLRGTTYHSPTIATGFGAHLAVPILRSLCPNDEDYIKVTEADARKALEDCMKVLYYRDARSIDRYSLATITAEGTKHEKGIRVINQNWAFADQVRGYGAQTV